MPQTLTDVLATLRATLDDPAADRYTDDALRAALRAALRRYETAHPNLKTTAYTTAAAGDAINYTPPSDFQTLTAIYNANGDPLPHYIIPRDGLLHIALTGPLPAAYTITIEYAAPHTIAGLDGAADTTVPDHHIHPLTLIAAAHAIHARAAALAEGNTISPKTVDYLHRSAAAFEAAAEPLLRQPPAAIIPL